MRIMTMMLVGVTSGFLGITNANAGIIFQQPQLIPGGYESDAASQAFDDFQFSSPISIIDKIDWEGNITTGKQASGFQLEIYSDSGGRPGSLIYVEDLSFTQTLLEDDGPSKKLWVFGHTRKPVRGERREQVLDFHRRGGFTIL